MKPFGLIALGILLALPNFIFAASGDSEGALWIEIKEKGDRETVIAITKEIAAFLVEADDREVCFSGKHEEELVTKEMIRDVLSGKRQAIEIHDMEEGQDISIFMKPLEIPHKIGRDQKLVLETRKGNKTTLRIAIPDIEIDAADEESNSVELSLGWKALLPFIAETGGAVYFRNLADDTEVWVYVN